MKLHKLISGMMMLAAMTGMMASCSSDDDPKNDDDSKVEMPQHRMFILNEGSYAANNATLTMFAPQSGTVTPDLFFLQNETMLGDMAMDMIEYDDYIYISVYGSNTLFKLDNNGVLQSSVYFAEDPELQGGVRYIAAEDGYVYASFYGGVVAKIDASTLTVTAKLTGIGANLEGVAIENDKLYVADSYEQTTDADGNNIYNYLTELKVIDLKSFTMTGTITVDQNPNLLTEENDMIFLISYGNYYDQPYSFQSIDPATGVVIPIAEATLMGAGNDKVYLVNAVTDWTTYTTTNTFFYYDIKSGDLIDSSFMKDAPAELSSANIYMISVDDETGDIYVGTTNYNYANGEIYRFKKDGSYVGKFDCGGQNPRCAVYFD